MDAKTSVFEKFSVLRKELEAAKNEARTRGSGLFKEGVQVFFEEYPQIKSFSWTQYTPYFNDGEPCVFGVNKNYYVKLNNGEPLEDVWFSNYKKKNNEHDFENQIAEFLDKIFETLPEEVFLDLFGDHAEITVSKEEIIVEEYDHE